MSHSSTPPPVSPGGYSVFSAGPWSSRSLSCTLVGDYTIELTVSDEHQSQSTQLSVTISPSAADPVAVAMASDITFTSSDVQTITVTYTAAQEIDASTIGALDIEVVLPDFAAVIIPVFLSKSSVIDTSPIVATYELAPVGGIWESVKKLSWHRLTTKDIGSQVREYFQPVPQRPSDLGSEGESHRNHAWQINRFCTREQGAEKADS